MAYANNTLRSMMEAVADLHQLSQHGAQYLERLRLTSAIKSALRIRRACVEGNRRRGLGALGDVRTTTITKGTVLTVTGRHLTARLDNGEIRTYHVPPNFLFDLDGKKVKVEELQKGMQVTGTKIVSDPEVEFSSLSVITGTAPK